MATRRPGRVYVLALIPPDQDSLFENRREWLESRLTPGRSVTRYNREWLLGKIDVAGNKLAGRIGFSGAEGSADVWDPWQQDFLPVAVPQGHAVPFVVDLQTLRLAVQTRGSDIRLNSVIGAFQAMLSEGGQRWRVRSPKRTMSFGEWRATVDKVTSVRFRVRRPNPHYRGTPNLEHMLEQSESEVVTLEMQSNDGLNTDFEFITESQEHVEAGYGEATYHGVSEDHESVYSTMLEAEETFEEAEVNAHGEVPHESLKALLDEEATEGETGVDE